MDLYNEVEVTVEAWTATKKRTKTEKVLMLQLLQRTLRASVYLFHPEESHACEQRV